MEQGFDEWCLSEFANALGKADDAKLDEFFTKTPDVTRWNDYYNHSNEPVHLVPFLFNRASAPWLTQKWVKFICEKAYGSDVYGLCGMRTSGRCPLYLPLRCPAKSDHKNKKLMDYSDGGHEELAL